MDRQFYHFAQESISHCCWYVARQLANDQDNRARCTDEGDAAIDCSQATYLPFQHFLPTPSTVLYGTAAFPAFSPPRNLILYHTVRSLERTVGENGRLESMWYQLIITKCPFNSIQSVCHKNYTLPVSNDECLAFLPLWRLFLWHVNARTNILDFVNVIDRMVVIGGFGLKSRARTWCLTRVKGEDEINHKSDSNWLFPIQIDFDNVCVCVCVFIQILLKYRSHSIKFKLSERILNDIN